MKFELLPIKVRIIRDMETRLEWIEVKAYPCPDAEGLYAHWHYPSGSKWVLTHKGSGLKVPDIYFRTRRLALECARRLGSIADWTQLPEVIVEKRDELAVQLTLFRSAWTHKDTEYVIWNGSWIFDMGGVG